MKFTGFALVIWFPLSLCTITIVDNDFIVRKLYEASFSSTMEPPSFIKGTLTYGGNTCRSVPLPPKWDRLEQNFAFIAFDRTYKCTMQTQFDLALSAGYHVVIFTEPLAPPRFTRPKDYNDLAVVILITENDYKFIINYQYNKTGAIIVYVPNPVPYVYHVLPLIMVGSGLVSILLVLMGYYTYRIIRKKYQQYVADKRILCLPTRKSRDSDEDEQCPICWENYKISETITVLHCKHEYHLSCLRRWKGEDCPLCRSRMYPQESSYEREPELINHEDVSSSDEECQLLLAEQNITEDSQDTQT